MFFLITNCKVDDLLCCMLFTSQILRLLLKSCLAMRSLHLELGAGDGPKSIADVRRSKKTHAHATQEPSLRHANLRRFPLSVML